MTKYIKRCTLHLSLQFWLTLLLNALSLVRAELSSAISGNGTSSMHSLNSNLKTLGLQESDILLSSHLSPSANSSSQILVLPTTIISVSGDESLKTLMSSLYYSLDEPSYGASETLKSQAVSSHVIDKSITEYQSGAVMSAEINMSSSKGSLHQVELNSTNILQHLETSMKITPTASSESLFTSSDVNNTVRSKTLTLLSDDSMSSYIQPSQHQQIQGSFSTALTNSYQQVGSISQTTIIPSNINSSRIQSNSMIENKNLKSFAFSTNSSALASDFRETEMIKSKSSVLITERRSSGGSVMGVKSSLMTSLALMVMTSLEASLSQAVNTTSPIDATTPTSQLSTMPNHMTTTIYELFSDSSKSAANAMISATGVFNTEAVNVTKLTSSVFNNPSPTFLSSSVMFRRNTESATISMSASEFKVQASTTVQQTTISVSLAPVTPSSPFVRDNYLIFLISGGLPNETFYQDLINKTSKNFTILAMKLENELQNRLNSSSVFVKADILNFTQSGNAVLFNSEVFFNLSANVTADLVKTKLERQDRSSYVISSVSVQELCSTSSCNNHGSCGKMPTEIKCICNNGFSGVRCQHAYPVDGNYTGWSDYQKCSKSCDEGIQIRTRSCTNPAPINGGKNCSKLGLEKQTRKCNIKECGIEDWVIWIIIAAVCFILLLVLILGCCFLRKAKYYYQSYGMTTDGRSYNLTKQVYVNEAYETHLSEYRTEASVVPLKVLKEDPFKNAYDNANMIAEQPSNGTPNIVYQRELKTFLTNAHNLRAKGDAVGVEEGEYLEPETNYHQKQPASGADSSATSDAANTRNAR